MNNAVTLVLHIEKKGIGPPIMIGDPHFFFLLITIHINIYNLTNIHTLNIPNNHISNINRQRIH